MGELILTALALLGVGSSATSSPSTTSGSSTQGPTVSPADAGVEPAVRTGGKRTPAFTSLIGICLRRRASRLAQTNQLPGGKFLPLVVADVADPSAFVVEPSWKRSIVRVRVP